MIKEERHNELIKVLKEKRFASVDYLSQKLFASLPTIRRDLAELENKGFLMRCHGGAMITDDEKLDIPIAFRNVTNIREKIKICKLAASLINDGNVIFMDASTTVLHIIDFIKNKKNITVVTNSMQACTLLYKYNIKTYCTGGFLLENSLAFVGRRAEEFVTDFHADIMFFSSCALDNEGYVTDYSEYEASLRKTMFKYANKLVFMCDNTKFNKSSIFNIIHLKNVDYIISDSPLPESLSEFKSKQLF